MREYGFELSLCAHLEGGAAPASVPEEPVVARQLGAGVADPGGRVIDTVLLEPGPEFDDRAAITPEAIPHQVLASALGPGRARRVTDAIDASPEYAREFAERAAAVGFLELEYRGGDLHARQVARYPEDWFGDLVGIENKPDLGSPGALATQLRTDVCLGCFDRVILATESHVTGAHRNRIPDSVGIWRYQPGDDGAADLEVIRPAQPLASVDPGVEILERSPGRTEIEVADAEAIALARRRIAERTYGTGWRPGAFPGCDQVESGEDLGSAAIPYCGYKERIVDPARECGPDCPGFVGDDPPSVDEAAERASRTPWVAAPEGRKRRQVGLDRFG